MLSRVLTFATSHFPKSAFIELSPCETRKVWARVVTAVVIHDSNPTPTNVDALGLPPSHGDPASFLSLENTSLKSPTPLTSHLSSPPHFPSDDVASRFTTSHVA